MKLTKDDLEQGMIKGGFKKAPTYIIIREILKNQEVAEHYDNLRLNYKLLFKDSEENKRIVERLKKRIEEANFMIESFFKVEAKHQYGLTLKDELQKILGEQK